MMSLELEPPAGCDPGRNETQTTPSVPGPQGRAGTADMGDQKEVAQIGVCVGCGLRAREKTGQVEGFPCTLDPLLSQNLCWVSDNQLLQANTSV